MGRHPVEKTMQPFRMPPYPPADLIQTAMLSYLTETLHDLSSYSELPHDTVLPLHKVACENMLPRIGDKPQVEGEVMDAGYLHSQEPCALKRW